MVTPTTFIPVPVGTYITAAARLGRVGPWISMSPASVARARPADTITSGISNRGTITAAERRAETVVVGARSAVADLLGCTADGVVVAESAGATLRWVGFDKETAELSVYALFYVDGVYLTPHAPITFDDLGADSYAYSRYKFLAPHHGLVVADPGLLEEVQADKLLPSSNSVPGCSSR